jgi:hypothetical protein
MEVVLPMRIFTPAEAIELIEGIQYRNHLAYISHRKRRLLELERFTHVSL